MVDYYVQINYVYVVIVEVKNWVYVDFLIENVYDHCVPKDYLRLNGVYFTKTEPIKAGFSVKKVPICINASNVHVRDKRVDVRVN